MSINVIVIRYVTETLISLLFVEICDILVSISYFDLVVGEGNLKPGRCFTLQVFNFAILKLFAGIKFGAIVKGGGYR